MEAAGRTSQRLGKVASRVAAAGNHPRTARRDAQDGPPRRRWRRGSSCAHATSPAFHPLPTALRRRRGRAMLLLGLIATSETFSAPLQGQEGSAAGAHRHQSCAPSTICALDFATVVRFAYTISPSSRGMLCATQSCSEGAGHTDSGCRRLGKHAWTVSSELRGRAARRPLPQSSWSLECPVPRSGTDH